MQLEHLEPGRPAVTAPAPDARAEAATQDDVLASFAARLDDYASSLPSRERRALDVLLLRAMSPLDRIRAQRLDGLLTPDELRALDQLDGDTSGG